MPTFAAAALALTLLSLSSLPAGAAIHLPPGFAASELARGIRRPTALAAASDGRVFVCEQDGRLRVIKNGRLLPDPFVSLSVAAEGERGLVGVVLHPDFPRTPYVYVYHTVTRPFLHNRISRFTAAGDRAVAGSEVPILDLPLEAREIHNGGAMRFAPDGKLLVAVGEHNQRPLAQQLDSPVGKLLRLNADGTIPSDNPFYDETTGLARAIWALGLRNPFTFDVHPVSGRVLINDVGYRAWEEINEGIAGANYGWPLVEGPSTNPAFRAPLLAYRHGRSDTTGCAITAGAFYEPPLGQFPPAYRGNYFFADFCSGWVRRLDTRNGDLALPFARGLDGPVGAAVGADGSLLLLTYTDGVVLRVTYTGSLAPQIGTQPTDLRAAAGATATFTVAVSGAEPFAYRWRRDGDEIAGATAATLVLPGITAADDGARFDVVVSNAHGSVTSRAALLQVVAGQPPQPAITTPAPGSFYRGGESIPFAGGALDSEDGALPTAALTWTVDFHHDTHLHPFLPATSGVAGGTLVVPAEGHTETNVWFRIRLAARDSHGLVGETHLDLHPRLGTLELRSEPAGLRLELDGTPLVTPLDEPAVVGVARTLLAPSPQVVGGLVHDFVDWSDGGGQEHVVVATDGSQRLTARFLPRPGPARGLLATYFAGPALGGPRLLRIDPQLSFAWGSGSPAPSIPADGFSARWSGKLTPSRSGRHSLYLRSDEGARLWLDGELLIDDWGPHPSRVASRALDLVAGRAYALRIEYRELSGPAGLRFLWREPGNGARVTVPSAALTPAE